MNNSIVEALAMPDMGRRSWRVALTKSVRRRISWIRTEWEIRRAIKELSVLDDRMLADIGLHRGQIPHAVRHLAPAPTTTDGLGR